MNPFERFQELRPEIIKDEIFMDGLSTYAFTDRLMLFGNKKVTPLGTGRNNIHFRIGKIGNIWLATREYLQAIDVSDHLFHGEHYIDAVVRTHNEGKRVPIVCGGVKAENDFGGRYFLLLEDLTQGGHADFQPAPKSGEVTGMLNGEEVYHDFDTDKRNSSGTNYLSEQNLIILRREK